MSDETSTTTNISIEKLNGAFILSTEKIVWALLGLVQIIVSFVIINMYNDIRSNQTALNQLALTIPTTYVRGDQFSEMNQRLIRIEDKLDRKVDK